MPRCIEQKQTLSGRTYSFPCELLHWEKHFGVLRYVLQHDYRVGGIALHPGDVTYALYWTNRPYTLYVWRLGGSGTAYYFNVADHVSLKPEEFVWRDLVVDILIHGDGTVQVLDENELPPRISPRLLAFIEAAKAAILRDHAEITREAEKILTTLPGVRPAL